jgi:hypothetical protein
MKKNESAKNDFFFPPPEKTEEPIRGRKLRQTFSQKPKPAEPKNDFSLRGKTSLPEKRLFN